MYIFYRIPWRPCTSMLPDKMLILTNR
jgi:hypothetical protein